MLRWVLLLLTAFTCRGEVPAAISMHIKRLAEEAQVFATIAPKVIGEEQLEQMAILRPSRFQPRQGPADVKYGTRRIVSEYGFAPFKEDGNLHEVRNVQMVDGKRVRQAGKLRETLSMGLKTDTDRTKKNMLKEFQGFGLSEAAMDFGQIILMFMPRQIEHFKFQPLRGELVAAEKTIVVSYEQLQGPAMTVFEGKVVKQHLLKGEVWLRESDGMPVRITLDTSRTENGKTLRHFGSVDYELSGHGCLLPATILFAESFAPPGGKPVTFVENRFRYREFKMFGASSEVKFTPEEEPAPPPTKK